MSDLTEQEMESGRTVLERAIQEYLDDLDSYLRTTWNSLSIEIRQKELYEVVGGILSRQVLLCKQLAHSSRMWNPEGGSIILRAMVDNQINLAYICHADSYSRAMAFIDYGLGQQKLYTAKLKEHIKKREATDLLKAIEDFESTWNSEKYQNLTDVNMGGWAGKSTREMAKEVGEDELYELMFVQYTFSTHGTWNHILQFNCVQSDNPMHAGMKVPSLSMPPTDIEFLFRASKYVTLSFRWVDRLTGMQERTPNPETMLHAKIDEAANSLRKNRSEGDATS